MSILLPALNRVKLQAQDVIDKSNQHQFALIWKLYTDEHDGLFPDRGSGYDCDQVAMAAWPTVIWQYMPSTDPELWCCPAATRRLDEGGRPPWAAWSNICDDTPTLVGSYAANFWVATCEEDCPRDPAKFWQTPNVRGASFAPLMLDCTWKDIEPEPYDPAPPYNGYMGIEAEELKRACINRHGWRNNMSFLDLSVKSIRLKCLWGLEWHRKWTDDAFPDGGWPEWMAHLPECY